MNYFPCNLPDTLSHLAEPKKSLYAATVQRIAARTEKLNQALDLSGMEAEAFANTAAKLFQSFDFEALTAEKIAELAQLSYDGESYEPRMEWPNAIPVIDCRFVSTADWELLRHIGLGGSDAASILGVSPYKTSLDTYHDKMGTELKGEKPKKESVFKRGHLLEDSVIEVACKLLNATRIPEYRMFQSAKFPAATANIDAILRLSDGKIAIFEAKTTIEENWSAWMNGQVPIQYIPQCHQYPAVLDDDRISGTYIGCLFTHDYEKEDKYLGSTYDGRDFKGNFVPRDTDEEQNQLALLQDFWETKIQAADAPELSENTPSRNIATLNAISGAAVSTDPIMDFDVFEWEDIVKARLDADEKVSAANAALEAAKESRAQIDQVFIEKLGTTVEGRMYTGVNSSGQKEYFEIKYSPRSRKTCDIERLRDVVDGLRTYGVPESELDNLLSCIYMKENARVFSLRKKVEKSKKTKK